MTQKQLEELEEQAFYESGLSADGCLEKLDSYAREAIQRYGRYLVESQKGEINLLEEDLRVADCEYIKVIKKLTKLEGENNQLKQQLKDIKEGFEGCCYACEPVGALNQELEAQLKAIEEDGTEEHNAAVKLRSKLAETLVQNDQWKDVARKLYGVVLHLQAVANDKPIIVVGDGLYSESVDAIKAYENIYGN